MEDCESNNILKLTYGSYLNKETAKKAITHAVSHRCSTKTTQLCSWSTLTLLL